MKFSVSGCNVENVSILLLLKRSSVSNFCPVYHPYLLDKSLESQVVARAYRMGAEEKVYVEQLVSRHSVEELIVMMNNRDRDTSSRNMLYDNPNHLVNFQSNYYDEEDLVENQDFVSSSHEKQKGSAKVRTLLSKVKLIQHGNVRKASYSKKDRKGPRITFEDDDFEDEKEEKTKKAKTVKFEFL